MYQKKIAIVTHQMIMGGIEKSLIELCKELQKRNIQITLYLEQDGGELYAAIPLGIKVISIFEKYRNLRFLIKEFVRQRKIKKLCALFKCYFINKFHRDPVKGWIENVEYLGDEQECYDYAFAYGAPVAFSTIYVDKKIKAKKKYAWIHNDPEQLSLDIAKYEECFRNYDKIICVSESTKRKFDTLFPCYELKTKVFYNIIDYEDIKKKANESVSWDNYDGKRLLTVGRLCDSKGQDIIPEITNRLVRENYNIKWYCVGDGELYSDLQSTIEKERLQDRVILLGNKKNPYPFFKAADIYVQPSRHEGFGITLTEAKIMKLPIVVTRFDGVFEQIDNGQTGLVVKFDIDEIYMAIKRLLDDEKLIAIFKHNLDTDTKQCVSDINELLS